MPHSLVTHWEEGLKGNLVHQDADRSCLSPVVVQFLSIQAKEINIIEGDLRDQLDLLNYLPFTDVDDCENESKKFRSATPQLFGMADSIHKLIRSKKISDLLAIFPECKHFLPFHQNIEEYLMLHETGDSFLCFQIIVSMIESGLYRIYQSLASIKTEETLSPKKLSDLLQTSHLRLVFPKEFLFLIRLFIGPLHSVNLRNLLWHGFILPSEFKEEYTSLLIAILFTASKLSHSFFSDNLQFQQCELPTVALGSGELQPLWESFSFEDLKSVVSNNYFLPWTNHSLWFQFLQKIEEKKYYQALILGFPLLEAALRRMYVVTNHCENSILTAEQENLYYTLDTLLEVTTNDRTDNKVFSFIPNAICTILYDYFIWNDAPRLRDLLAHGLISDTAIDCSHVSDFFGLVFVLCFQFTTNNNWKTPVIDQLERKCSEWLTKYTLKYHPKYQCIETMKQVVAKYNSLFGSIESTLGTSIAPSDVSFDKNLNAVIERIQQHIPTFPPLVDFANFSLDFIIPTSLCVVPITLRYRVRAGLCLRILETLLSFMNHIESSFVELHQKVITRTAWKRNREAYKELVSQFSWWKSIIPVVVLVCFERLCCSTESPFVTLSTEIECDQQNEFSTTLCSNIASSLAFAMQNSWKRMKGISIGFFLPPDDISYEPMLKTGLFKAKELEQYKNKLSKYFTEISATSHKKS